MLPRKIQATPNKEPNSAVRQRMTADMDAIISCLTAGGVSTLSAISKQTGLSSCVLRDRLERLRQAGEVRRAQHYRDNGTPSSISAWALGAEVDLEREDRPNRTICRAVQLGCFVRDPLVAALFGAPARGEPRCVDCQRPQGHGHADGCMFNGLALGAPAASPANLSA